MRAVDDLARREGDGPRALRPEAVAAVVVRAVTSRRPRPRYKVGAPARIGTLLRRTLTDRQWDAVLRRAVREPGARVPSDRP
jgi:hypothetical protein